MGFNTVCNFLLSIDKCESIYLLINVNLSLEVEKRWDFYRSFLTIQSNKINPVLPVEFLFF